jgi:hypothetical protein
MEEKYTAQLRRITHLLQVLVSLSGRSLVSIERDLETSSSYLGKILRGEVSVKIWHVLLILEAVDFPPDAFFRVAFAGTADDEPALAHLAAQIRDAYHLAQAGSLKPAAPAAQEPALSLTPELFEEYLRKALRKFIGLEDLVPRRNPANDPPAP